MKLFTPLISAFLLITISTQAYHIVGGTMAYSYVGSNSYDVSLTLYRDCSSPIAAPFDDPADVAVYDTSGVVIGILLVPLPGTNNVDSMIICATTGLIICLQKTTYHISVNNLMRPGGINVVYQRCCRNELLSSIYDPSHFGSTYFVHIPDTNLVSHNSSPVFSKEMNGILCFGHSYELDGSAADADGDSVVYSLFPPFQGADQLNPQPPVPPPPPYPSVIYEPPFTHQYPINSIPPFEMNESSGVFSVTPSSFGTFLIGEVVREYRNGILLDSVYRDFEWTVNEQVGINSVASNASRLQIAPDPFFDVVALVSPFQSASTLTIMNSQGEIISKRKLEPLERAVITVNNSLPRDLIFFQLVSDEGQMQSGIAVHALTH